MGYARPGKSFHMPEVNVTKPAKVDIKGIPEAASNRIERYTGHRWGKPDKASDAMEPARVKKAKADQADTPEMSDNKNTDVDYSRDLGGHTVIPDSNLTPGPVPTPNPNVSRDQFGNIHAGGINITSRIVVPGQVQTEE